MSETINCPQCNAVIELDKAMARKMEAGLEKELAKRLNVEKAKIIAESNRELDELQAKLDLANANEVALRKQKTELEQRAKDIDLEVQRKLDEEKSTLEARVAARMAEDHRAKDAEKDKKLSDTLAQVEDLKRRMEQGSQQLQGEVFELQLEEEIKKLFPMDSVEPVAKGVKGADIIQIVNSRNGEAAGSIMWELKRTKNYSSTWVPKLKEDLRGCRADVALLVTDTMPEGTVDCFRLEANIWIVSFRFCMHLCSALRAGILRAYAEKGVQIGKKDKAVVVYEYLCSQEFKGRVQGVIEACASLQVELDSEKRAMEKIWAKRQKTVDVAVQQLAGMHGDIEAIAAGEMPAIGMLQLGEAK